MPFQKGVSGNPAGRKPKSDTEKALRERIRSAAPAVIDALVSAAMAGDVPADLPRPADNDLHSVSSLLPS